MADQVSLSADKRSEHGKGPTGRLRRTGRVPGIVYGYETEPTAVHVDALELYHALHTEAGRNALIRLDVAGETTLVIARDLQIHPIRQEVQHVDFLAVDRDAQISVEIPIHLLNEDDVENDGGVLNLVTYSVSIAVKPMDVPNALEVDVTGMAIGDVKRVGDLIGLPDGADFEIDAEEPVVTITAPISDEELEEMEADAGVEQEQSDAEIAAEAAAEDDASSED